MNKNRHVLIENPKTNQSLLLKTDNEIKSILYGLRYWGRNELKFLDEFFREDIGSILYPIKDPSKSETGFVKNNLKENIRIDTDWTMFSIRDMALDICVKNHLSINNLFDAIMMLFLNFPGYVSLIPTSRSFASVTSKSTTRENFELRGYLQERSGRLISHIRLHRELRRLLNGNKV